MKQYANIIYIFLSLAVPLVFVFIYQFIDNLIYKVILAFISVIILSNCAAKLYINFFLNEDV